MATTKRKTSAKVMTITLDKGERGQVTTPTGVLDVMFDGGPYPDITCPLCNAGTLATRAGYELCVEEQSEPIGPYFVRNKRMKGYEQKQYSRRQGAPQRIITGIEYVCPSCGKIVMSYQTDIETARKMRTGTDASEFFRKVVRQ